MIVSQKHTRRPTSWLNTRLHLEPLEDRAVPATLMVNPTGAGGAFTTIGAAVAGSSDGDVIQVANGTYIESNIAVNHDVTIQGQSRAGVIVEPAAADSHDDSSFGGTSQYAFIIQHDGVTITNLTIDGNANALLAGDHNFRGGIITDFRTAPDDFDNLTVQNVTIQHVYRRGIQISDTSVGHLITGNAIDDIELANGNGIGIISFSGDGTFSNNTITNASIGIATNFADTINGVGPLQATIQGNSVTVNDGGTGLDLYGLNGGSLVSGNTINLTSDATSNIGILIGDSRNGPSIIQSNTITGSGGDTGILVGETSSATQPTISGNTLSTTGSTSVLPGEGVGILLTDDNSLTSTASGDTFATINNNTITGFATGISLLDSTTGAAASSVVGATIHDQVISNGTDGLVATGAVTDLSLTNVTVTGNSGNGVNVSGDSKAALTLSNVSITANAGTGLTATGFGTVTISDLTLTGGTPTNSIATAPGGVVNDSTSSGGTVTASGTQLQTTVGALVNDTITLSGEDYLNLTGSNSTDTFVITPPALGGAAISVAAGLPGPTPGQGTAGDVLDLTTTAGVTITSTFSSTTGFSGTAAIAGQPNITFSGIESFANGTSISGTVFNDADGSGVQNGSEVGLAGVTVQLDIDANGTNELTTTTDGSGHYSFPGLPPGDYRVRVVAPVGATQTTAQPADVTATLGSTATNVNFGFQFAAGTAGTSTVTGVVFNDANANHTRDAGEAGVNGLTVYLDLNGNGTLDANEPSTVSATVNGVVGSYTVTSQVVGTTARVRVVEKAGAVTNTTSTSVALNNGQTETVDVGVATTLPPQAAPATEFAVATVNGGIASVQVYNGNGAMLYSIPIPGVYPGGLRAATGDVTGDGILDVIVGTGPGVQASVLVFNGQTHAEIMQLTPFGTFTGGVFVTAGDLTQDGIADVIITPDQGGGPRVVVDRGGDFQTVLSFFGIDDPNFRGGARAGFGDINGDGITDLIVAAGFGGGPRVSIYSGVGLTTGNVQHLMNDFFAFDSTLRNGVYVAGGDVNGDGFDDLIIGAGPGGGPRVLVLSGQVLTSQGSAAALASPLENFFAGNPDNRGGIRVAAKDLNGDGLSDLVTGDGNGGQITGYNGKDATQRFHFDAIDDTTTTDGIYVG